MVKYSLSPHEFPLGGCNAFTHYLQCELQQSYSLPDLCSSVLHVPGAGVMGELFKHPP